MADLSVPPDVAARILRDPPGYTATVAAAPSFAGQQAAAQALRAPRMPQVDEHPDVEEAPNPRKWSALDKVLQGAFAGASYFDAADTANFLRKSSDHFEENPLLGSRPSAAKLYAATTLGQALHGAISDRLPSGWPRTAWQIATLLAEGSVIASNHGFKPADNFWGGLMGDRGHRR